MSTTSRRRSGCVRRSTSRRRQTPSPARSHRSRAALTSIASRRSRRRSAVLPQLDFYPSVAAHCILGFVQVARVQQQQRERTQQATTGGGMHWTHVLLGFVLAIAIAGPPLSPPMILFMHLPESAFCFAQAPSSWLCSRPTRTTGILWCDASFCCAACGADHRVVAVLERVHKQMEDTLRLAH